MSMSISAKNIGDILKTYNNSVQKSSESAGAERSSLNFWIGEFFAGIGINDGNAGAAVVKSYATQCLSAFERTDGTIDVKAKGFKEVAKLLSKDINAFFDSKETDTTKKITSLYTNKSGALFKMMHVKYDENVKSHKGELKAEVKSQQTVFDGEFTENLADANRHVDKKVDAAKDSFAERRRYLGRVRFSKSLGRFFGAIEAAALGGSRRNFTETVERKQAYVPKFDNAITKAAIEQMAAKIADAVKNSGDNIDQKEIDKITNEGFGKAVMPKVAIRTTNVTVKKSAETAGRRAKRFFAAVGVVLTAPIWAPVKALIKAGSALKSLATDNWARRITAAWNGKKYVDVKTAESQDMQSIKDELARQAAEKDKEIIEMFD